MQLRSEKACDAVILHGSVLPHLDCFVYFHFSVSSVQHVADSFPVH